MNSYKHFDREKLLYRPLSERYSKVDIAEASVDPDGTDELVLDDLLHKRIDIIAEEIMSAKRLGAAVICAFGAHTIKNGMGRVLSALVKEGWVSHLATNGAGVIHDWEFSYLGKSSEDVRSNVQTGQFGTWQETGKYINLALCLGAYRGMGYGEAIGAMIAEEGLYLPGIDELKNVIDCRSAFPSSEELSHISAAADLLELLLRYEIDTKFIPISHPYKAYSIQAACYKLNAPFTSHPMFGHDIIYTHEMNRGAAIGRTAERDFLRYASSVSELEHGVYLSVGSAVMSPMIFEKSLSMSRNLLLQHNRDIRDCGIHVVDLQAETWNWDDGEPPMDNPAYYLRFMKSFHRMGCRVDYTSADNKIFLLSLLQRLRRLERNG